MSFGQLAYLIVPEAMIVLTALIVLAADLTIGRKNTLSERFALGAALSIAGCIGSIMWIATHTPTATESFYDGALVMAPLSQLIKQAILMFTIVTAWISASARFSDHPGEYFALVLLATVGMMFLVSTEHVLMIFVSLELLSLSLYVLTAFSKQSIASAEAGLKYFLFGGTSAAIMLFGISLLYGVTDQLNLGAMAASLGGRKLDPLFIVGMIMVVAGFGFKIAAAPFHLWAPDAYQGAPIPSAAFIASGSKVASFYVLAKVAMVGFDGAEGSAAFGKAITGWVPLLAVVASISILLGNLTAIVQKSVRRLLAYSAVAHAGYMLVGLLSDQDRGMASVLFYALSYAATTLGAFVVVGVVQDAEGSDSLSAFAGLGRQAPVLAFCMMIFMLSLAGIPPLVGFFGKFYLFAAALSAPSSNLTLLWLVVLAIAMSAVSLYYYLQVLKQIYVAPAPADGPVFAPSFNARAAALLLAATVVVLGLSPNLLLRPILHSLASAPH